MEVLDGALERFAGTGPEFGGGLSSHGPMAAEALVGLGRADAVERWVDGYLPRLGPEPERTAPIGDWREALGDFRRVTDWSDYFAHRFEEAPWPDVVSEWWPRLVPGLAAGATHGIIRAAHAVRAVADRPGPVRLAELAHALGYWAARYAELPGTPRTGGNASLDDAIRALPLMREIPPGGLITEQLAGLGAVRSFPEAVGALRPPGDVDAGLGELTRTFSGLFLTHGRRMPIVFLHAVTAPAAVRSVLPLLPGALHRPTYDALWQVAAGIYSAFGTRTTPEPLPYGDPPGPEEVAARAVDNGDEHAIKLAEACLREHARTPDPVYLHAAARAAELL
ncbi:questin oxidase family protein [Streptosporangium roseum]|uniref:DUF4243 domain-containing protein n=1 Tax=Streptosporangium roseum (strain ATCC 12428 / DSM 43021 / JCM 3005 / KCTC 9067 / NCIMB 10171 / NRRL 2505 / NI 9100) TaxID=479432 RepID=D2B3T5_STRRD|nr:questin oxidase family protein [Streptosporangium roseum]ACZ89370.1 conserved hypothetical protein [Streptosporangium roseum DSM 43021]